MLLGRIDYDAIFFLGTLAKEEKRKTKNREKKEKKLSSRVQHPSTEKSAKSSDLTLNGVRACPNIHT